MYKVRRPVYSRRLQPGRGLLLLGRKNCPDRVQRNISIRSRHGQNKYFLPISKHHHPIVHCVHLVHCVHNVHKEVSDIGLAPPTASSETIFLPGKAPLMLFDSLSMFVYYSYRALIRRHKESSTLPNSRHSRGR